MVFSVSEAEEYFQLHLKYEIWQALPEAKKMAALNMAEQDVAAYLDQYEVDASEQFQYAAVFEQAIFLVENYDRLASGQLIVAEKVDGVGSRSYQHIASRPLHIAPRALLLLERVNDFCRLSRV